MPLCCKTSPLPTKTDLRDATMRTQPPRAPEAWAEASGPLNARNRLPPRLLRKLLKGSLSLRIIGMSFQESEQNGSSFLRHTSQRVNLREIHVAPTECGCDSDALLKTCDRATRPLRREIQNSPVVHGFWAGWPDIQGLPR